MAYITGACGGKFDLGRVNGKSIYQHYIDLLPEDTTPVDEDTFTSRLYTHQYYSFQLSTDNSNAENTYIIPLTDVVPIGVPILSVDYTMYTGESESLEAEEMLSRITDTRLILIDDVWHLQFQVRDINNLPDSIWVILYPIDSKDDIDYEILNWSPVSPIPVILGGGSKDFNLTTKIESREVI